MKTFENIAIFAIAATVVFSFIYFILLEKMKKIHSGESRSKLIRRYLVRKLGGAFILGIIPAILAMVFFQVTPQQMGFTLGDLSVTWPWISGASLLLVLLNFFNTKSEDLRAIYPELRLKSWAMPELSIAITGWIVYLAAYEYLFRGLLLSSCYQAFGLWPAVTINLALYAALHLPKGMKEAIATIPFGALVIYLTLESGSILPAIFLHSLQAVTCELFCIYRNPEMEFHLHKKI